MSAYPFSILSPGGRAYEGQAEYVSAPGALGGFGVLSGHAPMIAAVKPGLTTVKAGGGELFFYTGEGVIEVSRAEVVMLVDEAQAVANPAQAKELIVGRMNRAAGVAKP